MPKRSEEISWQDMTPDDAWAIFLNEGSRGFAKLAPRHVIMVNRAGNLLLRAIPTDPRCVACKAPFRGLGAPFMRAIGRGQSEYNPSLCADCENMALKHGTRAEVPLTMIFADIRGSTPLAEELGPEEFSEVVGRFYTVATNILVKAGSFVDKFIGDEVSAYFVPGMVGEGHAKVALEAGREILRATGHYDVDGPWAPVGVGIHSGPAVVGALGKKSDGLNDITVFGDTANTAARLAASAGAGEIIASDETVRQAGVDVSGVRKQELKLKGKKEPVAAWTLK